MHVRRKTTLFCFCLGLLRLLDHGGLTGVPPKADPCVRVGLARCWISRGAGNALLREKINKSGGCLRGCWNWCASIRVGRIRLTRLRLAGYWFAAHSASA